MEVAVILGDFSVFFFLCFAKALAFLISYACMLRSRIDAFPATPSYCNDRFNYKAKRYLL